MLDDVRNTPIPSLTFPPSFKTVPGYIPVVTDIPIASLTFASMSPRRNHSTSHFKRHRNVLKLTPLCQRYGDNGWLWPCCAARVSRYCHPFPSTHRPIIGRDFAPFSLPRFVAFYTRETLSVSACQSGTVRDSCISPRSVCASGGLRAGYRWLIELPHLHSTPVEACTEFEV